MGVANALEYLDATHISFADFIAWSFSLTDTPEGINYWGAVANKDFKSIYSNIYSNLYVKEICVIPTRNKCFTKLFNRL